MDPPAADERRRNRQQRRRARGERAAGVLSLLFVPAGVGVVQYLGLLSEHWVALAASVVVSTIATLLATVGVFLLVKRRLAA